MKAEQWYKALPEPYRSQAVKNLTNNEREFTSLLFALRGGFLFSDAKEGFDYWYDFAFDLEQGKVKLKKQKSYRAG